MGKTPDVIEKNQNQWQSINLLSWNEKQNTKKFWYEVHNFRNCANVNPFEELSGFALELLIIPHSNAEVERLFNKMNFIKNKIRNRFQLPMLSFILSIKAGLSRYSKCCNTKC